MHTLIHRLAHTRRPRLLLRAARIGAEDYRREPHLRRLIGGTPETASGALKLLMAAEATLDATRRSGMAGYAPARHVALLAAIIGEARLLRRQIAGSPDETDAQTGNSAFLRATNADSASATAGSIAGAA